MYRSMMAILLGALVFPALAQTTPVGVWRTIDDKTGEVSSEVRIVEEGGALSGTIEKLLRKDAKQDNVCDKCTDERKDKLILGMKIIRGAKKSDGKDIWEGGKILDPDNGKEYKGTEGHAFVGLCRGAGVGQKFTRCSRPQTKEKRNGSFEH